MFATPGDGAPGVVSPLFYLPFFIIGFGCGFFAVPASLGLMKFGRGLGDGALCTPPLVASR
jgi:hypothetical protein